MGEMGKLEKTQEIGRKLGGNWEETGRKLGGNWEQTGTKDPFSSPISPSFRRAKTFPTVPFVKYQVTRTQRRKKQEMLALSESHRHRGQCGRLQAENRHESAKTRNVNSSAAGRWVWRTLCPYDGQWSALHGNEKKRDGREGRGRAQICQHQRRREPHYTFAMLPQRPVKSPEAKGKSKKFLSVRSEGVEEAGDVGAPRMGPESFYCNCHWEFAGHSTGPSRLITARTRPGQARATRRLLLQAPAATRTNNPKGPLA